MVEAIPSLKKDNLPGPFCGFPMKANINKEKEKTRLTRAEKIAMDHHTQEKPTNTITEKVSKVKFQEEMNSSMNNEIDSTIDRATIANNTIIAAKKPKRLKIEENSNNTGLAKTISELFDNYIPNSEYEKRPYWCRCCKHLSTDSNNFDLHLSSNEHVIIAEEDRKRSYCHLCHKQFTSPEQLKEHVNGNKHKEQLISRKNSQYKQQRYK